MLEISQPTGTTTSDWFVDKFFESEKKQAEQENKEMWDIIEGQIEDIETNTIFHLFLLGNPYGYMYQENASGSFTGLSPTDGRLEMLRAVYEGIAFMHRWQIEQYDKAFGVDEIRLTGGAARSEFWSELFANVLEMPISITDKEESGCFGAAMLAGIAVDKIDNLEATGGYINITNQYRPDETNIGQKYEAFRRLAVLMEDAWDEHENLRTSVQ